MEDRTSMGRPLEKDEIKNAIYSFKPLKSPRPDGLHPLFFQKYWSDIEESVVNTGMKIFSSCTIPPELSKTFICLISKIKNLEQITHYRPNSLCITIYETITKVLVNRIRPYLDSIICPQQCSFILGRRVVDNAIIVQEAIHSFQKTKGKCGKMMLKIDLQKAFDRMELSFIKQSLSILNFPKNTIDIIMSCISTSSISILVNSNPTTYFLPTIGIRQGYPLSPYIFIMCVEALSQLINYAIKEKLWQPLKIGRMDLQFLISYSQMILL